MMVMRGRLRSRLPSAAKMIVNKKKKKKRKKKKQTKKENQRIRTSRLPSAGPGNADWRRRMGDAIQGGRQKAN